MVEHNRQKIIEEIIKNKSISRADLAKIVQLNKATITTHINQLISSELVIETEFDISTGGRRPILLTINKNAGYSLGIDLTRDTITSYLLNINGDLIHKTVSSYDFTNYQELLIILKKEINLAIKQSAFTKYGLIGIGISIHGLVRNNKIIQFHNQLPQYHLYNDLISDFKHIPFNIENNANLGAIAEQSFNKNISENFLYLTILRGLGLGIIFNHQLYKGRIGLAGEFGHTIIEIDGRKCRCGNSGCLEQYASIPALLESLSQMKQTKIDFEKLKQLLEKNDQDAVLKVKLFVKYLTVGLNNLIQLFDADKIIIESEVYSEFLSKILQEDISKLLHRNTVVEFSKIEENSSALGAAILQICQFLNIQHFYK